MARYLLGLLLLAVAIVPVGVAARAWRSRYLPIDDWATALLADVVLTLAALVVAIEVLGTVHGFHLVPTTILLTVGGLAAWWMARSRRAMVAARTDGAAGRLHLDREWPDPALHTGPPVIFCAVAAVAMLAAAWAARTVDAFNHGMTTTDTLWYHMPFAARFADSGSTTGLHYVDSGTVVPFYPANSELLHAIGIVFMGNDLFSPLLNLGWMALLLLAAWCIGRRFGVGWVSVMGAAVLLDTPGFVATQPGGAYTDVVGLALFLSSAALLVVWEGSDAPNAWFPVALAALAAGLAFGTKFTLVAPVALLTIGFIAVARHGARLRQGGLWVGLVVLTGGYWYVRNLVSIGNPLPSLTSVGPFHLPSPRNTQPSSTVAHFLFDSMAWRKFFLPGLRSSLGPAWWAVLAFAAVGIIGVIIWRRTSVVRMLGLVAVGSVLAFLVTPQFLGTKTAPIFFQYNLRYASPGLLIGFAVLPLVPALARRSRLAIVAVLLLGVLAAIQFDPTLWPTTFFSKPFSLPTSVDESLLGAAVGVGIILAAALALWLFRRYRQGRSARLPTIATLALVVAVVAGGYPLQRHYLANRYTNQPPPPSRISAWAQNVNDSRIALVGFFSASQYPYYGRNSNNYVQYLVNVGPNGNLFPYSTCDSWRRALYRGGYDYLIISSSPEELWASTDHSYHKVTGQVIDGVLPILVYRLDHRLDLRSCPAVRAHVVD